jgi:predicted nucleotidyltransferase
MMPLDEKELIGMIFQRWEKEWKDEKNKQVASIYNQIVEIIAKEKAHIDEMIVALEIALQEALDAKVKMIRQERKIPAEVKG